MSGGSFSERFASWFEGRCWRVMNELSGTVAVGGIQVAYDKGAFEIARRACTSPRSATAGAAATSSWRLCWTGSDLLKTGAVQAFGEATLRRAQRDYGLVTGLPEES